MRIGIVGSDNTHALGFAEVANLDRFTGADVSVVAICGDDPSATRQVAKRGRIPDVLSGPDEMAGRVDAAIIVNRDGAVHRSNAAPFLRAGLPVLVDKPLAATLADAQAILAQAHEHAALVTSYSSLRWCADTRELGASLSDVGSPVLIEVSGLCDFASPYSGHFFYGIHEVEIALALHPTAPTVVRADPSGAVRTVTIQTADRCVVALNLIGATDGVLPQVPFAAACYAPGGRVGRTIKNEPDLSTALDIFLAMVASGEPPLTDEQLLTPIAVLEAIGESARTGGVPVELPATL
jgi:predicted dehydrogenase